MTREDFSLLAQSYFRNDRVNLSSIASINKFKDNSELSLIQTDGVNNISLFQYLPFFKESLNYIKRIELDSFVNDPLSTSIAYMIILRTYAPDGVQYFDSVYCNNKDAVKHQCQLDLAVSNGLLGFADLKHANIDVTTLVNNYNDFRSSRFSLNDLFCNELYLLTSDVNIVSDNSILLLSTQAVLF